MHRAQCLPRVVGREWVDAEPDRHRQTGRQTARQKLCSLCNVTHPALGARPSQPRANRVTDQQYAGITRGLWSSPSPTPPPPKSCALQQLHRSPSAFSPPAAQPWGSQPPQEVLQTPIGSPSTSQSAWNRGAPRWVQCSSCAIPIAEQSWGAPPRPAGPALGNHGPSGPPEHTAGSWSPAGRPLVKRWSTIGRSGQHRCAAHGHCPAQVGALHGGSLGSSVGAQLGKAVGKERSLPQGQRKQKAVN